MLANKERILQKMDQFKLDAVIAAYPENVSYLSDFPESYPLHVPSSLHGKFRPVSPAGTYISPAIIIMTVDASWAARFPTWIKEVYTFGNPYYDLDPEEKPMEGKSNL